MTAPLSPQKTEASKPPHSHLHLSADLTQNRPYKARRIPHPNWSSGDAREWRRTLARWHFGRAGGAGREVVAPHSIPGMFGQLRTA